MRPFTALYYWVLVLLTPFFFVPLSNRCSRRSLERAKVSSVCYQRLLCLHDRMDNEQSLIVRREESKALLSPIHQKSRYTLIYSSMALWPSLLNCLQTNFVPRLADNNQSLELPSVCLGGRSPRMQRRKSSDVVCQSGNSAHIAQLLKIPICACT